MRKLPPLTRAPEYPDDDAAWAQVTANTDHLDDSECWVWTGRVLEGGTVTLPDGTTRTYQWPVLDLPMRRSEHVRRFVWAYSNPEEDLTGWRVRLTRSDCDPLCVNPEHLTVEPQVGRRVASAEPEPDAVSPWDVPKQWGPNDWRTPRQTYLRHRAAGRTEDMARMERVLGPYDESK